MKTKQKEPYPDIYKIVYRLKRWKTRSERYFTVFSAQQAFNDFYYTFMSGHVNSDRITLYRIEVYNRFSDKWVDVTSEIQLDLTDNITKNILGKHVISRCPGIQS